MPKRRREEHVCRFCPKSFDRPSKLIRHEETHTDKPYMCQFCGRVYKDIKLANTHVIAYHKHELDGNSQQYLKPIHDDKHCRKTGRQKKVKHRHKSRLASGVDAAACDNYQCDCGLRFQRKRRIKQHQLYCQIHTNRVKARESSKNESQREKQYKKSKGDTSHEFRCDRCSSTFRLMESLQEHKRCVHRRKNAQLDRAPNKIKRKKSSGGRVVNNVVPGVAATISMISSSTVCHTSSAIKPVSIGAGAWSKCGICGQMLVERNLDYHHRLHSLAILNENCLNEGTSPTMQVLYLCRYETCGRAFLNKHKLSCHEVVHLGSKPFMCDLCDKQSETKLQHESHVLTCMLQLKENACWYCGKFFANNSDLVRHEDSHVKRRGAQYVCGHCSKHLTRRLQLNKHHCKLHQNLKPQPKDDIFQCRFCSIELSSKSKLIDHTQTEHRSVIASSTWTKDISGELTGDEKEWECKRCGKTFDQKIILTKHEKSHTTQAPLKCNGCGRSFVLRMALQRHSVNCLPAVATSTVTAIREEATGTVSATEESDEDIISISSSSPSPSPPPCPEMKSVQIQRLKPTPMRRPGSTEVHHQFTVSTTNGDCAATASSSTGSIAQPRDQVYLIQYSSEHMTHGPLTISLPDTNTSRSAIRVLPEGVSPAFPIPVKLERVL